MKWVGMRLIRISWKIVGILVISVISLTACGGSATIDAATLLTEKEISSTSTLEPFLPAMSLDEQLHESCAEPRKLLGLIAETNKVAQSEYSLSDGSLFLIQQYIFEAKSEDEAVNLVANLRTIPSDKTCFSEGRKANDAYDLQGSFDTSLTGIAWNGSYYSRSEFFGNVLEIQLDDLKVFATKGSYIYALFLSTEPASEITKADFNAIAKKALAKFAG
jgi:hypothetical protein